jgi:hypothetical protein
MNDQMYALVTLRNLLADAADQAMACDEKAVYNVLVALQVQVIRDIVESDSCAMLEVSGRA